MDTSIKYTGLQQPYQDDSSVDETLIDEEKHTDFYDRESREVNKSTCQRILAVLSSVRYLIDTVLLVIILILLLRRQDTHLLPKTSEHEVGGDFTGVSPHCTYCRMSIDSVLISS